MTATRTFDPPFTEVRCDGETIQVKWVRHITRLKSGYMTGGDYADHVIRLAWGGNTRRGLRIAFVHELMHYGIERDGGIPRNTKPGPLEEAMCGSAEWLALVLGENPRVAAWLTDPLE